MNVHVDTVERPALGHQKSFLDVFDENATGEDGSVSQHDDHSTEHPLASGLSCDQRDFSAFASRHRFPLLP